VTSDLVVHGGLHLLANVGGSEKAVLDHLASAALRRHQAVAVVRDERHLLRRAKLPHLLVGLVDHLELDRHSSTDSLAAWKELTHREALEHRALARRLFTQNDDLWEDQLES